MGVFSPAVIESLASMLQALQTAHIGVFISTLDSALETALMTAFLASLMIEPSRR
jgi:hypothetical protein